MPFNPIEAARLPTDTRAILLDHWRRTDNMKFAHINLEILLNRTRVASRAPAKPIYTTCGCQSHPPTEGRPTPGDIHSKSSVREQGSVPMRCGIEEASFSTRVHNDDSVLLIKVRTDQSIETTCLPGNTSAMLRPNRTRTDKSERAGVDDEVLR
jgi:hypothetical protein